LSHLHGNENIIAKAGKAANGRVKFATEPLVEEAHAIFKAITVSKVLDMNDRQLQKSVIHLCFQWRLSN